MAVVLTMLMASALMAEDDPSSAKPCRIYLRNAARTLSSIPVAAAEFDMSLLHQVLEIGDRKGFVNGEEVRRFEFLRNPDKFEWLLWLFQHSKNFLFSIQLLDFMHSSYVMSTMASMSTVLSEGPSNTRKLRPADLVRFALPKWFNVYTFIDMENRLAREYLIELLQSGSMEELDVNAADMLMFKLNLVPERLTSIRLRRLSIRLKKTAPWTSYLFEWVSEEVMSRVEKRLPNYEPILKHSPMQAHFQQWIENGMVENIISHLNERYAFGSPLDFGFIVQMLVEMGRSGDAIEVLGRFFSIIPDRRRILPPLLSLARSQIANQPDRLTIGTLRFIGRYGVRSDLPSLKIALKLAEARKDSDLEFAIRRAMQNVQDRFTEKHQD